MVRFFMERFIRSSPPEIRHYFLGADDDCLARLSRKVLRLNENIQLVGSHHGYFASAEEPRVFNELQRKEPDFVWVGMGTPKQDEWVSRHRRKFRHAILLPVGSSFEFLGGSKRAPPMLFQRAGLTWFFRMCSEPGRLFSALSEVEFFVSILSVSRRFAAAQSRVLKLSFNNEKPCPRPLCSP